MYNQIRDNQRRSVLLVFFVVAVLLALGAAFGVYIRDLASGLLVAAALSIILTLVGYFQGDKVALSIAGAKRVERRDNETLYRLVENLAISQGMPTPTIYLIDDPTPNAFATGRKPANASIAVSTGLLRIMEKTELEGVLAHELAHIKNADTRLMTLIVVLVGSIIILSDLLSHGFFFGRGDRREGAGPLLVIGILLAIFSPIVAQLIKLAISREREYLADASAAMATRYPEGLARALEKIATLDRPMARASHATAHLFLASPFDPKVEHSRFERLFSTHPPITERILRLRTISYP